MQEQPKIIFELLVIDPVGDSKMQNVRNLAYALMSAGTLWHNPDLRTEEGKTLIVEQGKSFEVELKCVDPSYFKSKIYSAFQIIVKGPILTDIEHMRIELIKHVNKKLDFQYVAILRDDVSVYLSTDIYKMITFTETLLRSYLTRFFTRRFGVGWFDSLVHWKVNEKVAFRQDRDKKWSPFLANEIMTLDMSELGALIYKPANAHHTNAQMMERLMKAKPEEFERIKKEFANDYQQVLKKEFVDRNFEQTWKQLAAIRNKVAHNQTIDLSDKLHTEALMEQVKAIIKHANKHIDDESLEGYIGSVPSSYVPPETKNVYIAPPPAEEPKPEPPLIREPAVEPPVAKAWSGKGRKPGSKNKKTIEREARLAQAVIPLPAPTPPPPPIPQSKQPIVQPPVLTQEEEELFKPVPSIPLKVVGKIQLPKETSVAERIRQDAVHRDAADKEEVPNNMLPDITEDELFIQLNSAIQWQHKKCMKYIGLKGFVNRFIADKWNKQSAVNRINLLVDSGKIEIGEIADENSTFVTRTIKFGPKFDPKYWRVLQTRRD